VGRFGGVVGCCFGLRGCFVSTGGGDVIVVYESYVDLVVGKFGELAWKGIGIGNGKRGKVDDDDIIGGFKDLEDLYRMGGCALVFGWQWVCLGLLVVVGSAKAKVESKA